MACNPDAEHQAGLGVRPRRAQNSHDFFLPPAAATSSWTPPPVSTIAPSDARRSWTSSLPRGSPRSPLTPQQGALMVDVGPLVSGVDAGKTRYHRRGADLLVRHERSYRYHAPLLLQWRSRSDLAAALDRQLSRLLSMVDHGTMLHWLQRQSPLWPLALGSTLGLGIGAGALFGIGGIVGVGLCLVVLGTAFWCARDAEPVLVEAQTSLAASEATAVDTLDRTFDNYEFLGNRKLKFYEKWKLDHRTNYEGKAQFEVIEKKFITSHFTALKWMDFLVNIEPVIYERFFAGIFSPEEVYFKLRAIK